MILLGKSDQRRTSLRKYRKEGEDSTGNFNIKTYKPQTIDVRIPLNSAGDIMK